ncbi:MAG TPA: SMP-30/gluconolactonase/LRE family protein [Chloroflexota bacterium]|nr:SMP-30/gluconolactonase/LRE family protein [Chloroflexota bacterium]
MSQVAHGLHTSPPTMESLARRSAGYAAVPADSRSSRHGMVRAAGLLAGVAALAPGTALAQGAEGTPRAFGPDAEPQRYPDPDIKSLDSRFNRYRIGNTAIKRLWTGALWSEGPAWSGVGRYLVWSDIPNNIQLRWLEDDGRVTVFRNPSGNSNGNTFDWQGRQISCEHLNRRVVRYEYDGSVTALAETFEGRPFNSPNDAVVHPNGSIWFTDPPYGTSGVGGYEGRHGELFHRNAVYRIDQATGRIDRVTDEPSAPNGLCFSHDYRRLYVVDTGQPRIFVYDVVDEARLANGRIFSDMKLGGQQVGPDGVRADIDGNIWASAAWTGPGYDGVIVFTPEGEPIGQILLPEMCSNITFGGPKRNRLFMTGSQSLYAVYVNTRGAHVA